MMYLIDEIEKELKENKKINEVVINQNYYQSIDQQQLQQYLEIHSIKLSLTEMKYNFRFISDCGVIQDSRTIINGKRKMMFTRSVSDIDNSREAVLAVMGRGYTYNEDIDILKSKDKELAYEEAQKKYFNK